MKSATPSPVVPWFGGVPKHWPIKPLGYLVSLSGGSTPSKDRADFWGGDLPWVSPKDMKRWVISDSEDHVAPAAIAQTSLTLFEPPAVLIVVRGMILAHSVPVAVAAKPVTINQDMKVLLPGPLVTASFLAYALRAAEPAFLSMVEAAGHGTQCLRTDLWQKLRVPVPPLIEQRTISAFLDRKTAEIDAVVAKKQRMIELLCEERQAVISRAVTRGLDVGVTMKDTDNPWLGSIPMSWQVERLKFRMVKIEQGWSPQCENQQAEAGEWGVLKVGCMNSGTYDESENKALPASLEPAPELEVRVGDVLMSRSNTVALVGSTGIVHRTQGRILLCDKLYRVVFDTSRLQPEYAVHLLRSHPARLQIERDASGASPSMKNISNEVVGNLVLAFPTVHEQQGICAHIDRETSRIDGLIGKNEQQIARLREYRQTLISAVATGKFTVPLEETPDFRAAVLAAEIIYSHPATKPLGRTKLHKELYATEHECDLVGIDADYARMPFGPYDDRLQKAVERELEAREWYRAVPGDRGKVNYVPLAQAGQHRAYFDRFYADKAEAIARLVGLLRPLNKNKIERAVTLYAAWNDFLIRGKPVDDERLLTEVQKNWHPEKQHKEESWRESLAWLKARTLIPHGFGRPTRPTDVLTGLSTAPEDNAGEAEDTE